jgi:NAD(P)-dependent dehydrogenase (short-subunit alcohol dehydrogenase family)
VTETFEPDATSGHVSDLSLHSLRQGYKAVVIGASGGVGSALCATLRRDVRLGVLVELSRKNDGFDITSESEVAKQAASIQGAIDLLICATGVLTVDGTPPEKSIRQIDPNVMAKQFLTNAIGPALIAKHFLPKLPRYDRSIAAFLSARVGSIRDNRIGGWISYRSSKAALNQIVRTASIELCRTHPRACVVAIHPGTVQTPLSAPYSRGHTTVTPLQAALNVLGTLERLNAEETGSFLAYDGSAIDW